MQNNGKKPSSYGKSTKFHTCFAVSIGFSFLTCFDQNCALNSPWRVLLLHFLAVWFGAREGSFDIMPSLLHLPAHPYIIVWIRLMCQTQNHKIPFLLRSSALQTICGTELRCIECNIKLCFFQMPSSVPMFTKDFLITQGYDCLFKDILLAFHMST